MDGFAAVIAVVALLILTFWLTLYCYVLYQLGRSFGDRYRIRVRPLFAAPIIAILAALIAAPFWPVFEFYFYKLTLVFTIWILHAQPFFVGYLAKSEDASRVDQVRFEAQTEEWLAEWEPDPELPEKI